MTNNYDFILFENNRFAINHYKDIKIIANLLERCGYKVAVLDIYKESEYIDSSYTHIQHNFQCHLIKVHNIPVISTIENIINGCKWNRYLKRVLKSIKGQYKNAYVGSLQDNMRLGWMNSIPSDVKVFIWGLRSHWLTVYKRKPISLRGVNTWFLHRFFLNHKNFNFFVSDEIIKSEYINLGFEPCRLVIRPERIIQIIPSPKKERKAGAPLKLLSIGLLRPDKRIELVLDSIKDIDSNLIEYTIAGISDPVEYEKLIEAKMSSLLCVRRLNYRIPDDEFNSLMTNTDFIILCDVKQLSSVTNGTLLESLLMGTPIIAPNYAPYDSMINNYEVGIMFNPDKPATLTDAIQQAINYKLSDHREQFESFQKKYMMESVVKSFGEQLGECLSFK